MPLFWRVLLVNAGLLVLAAAILLSSPVTISSPIRAAEVGIVIAGLVAGLVANVVLLRPGFASLERLSRRMEDVDLLRPGQRLPAAASPEVARLISAFNAMLDRLEAERRASGRRALVAQEAERLRIARGLHDEVGQTMTGVLLQLQRLADRAPEDLIRNRLRELERNVQGEGPPERAAALAEALGRLAPEIEGLTSPRASGRGRVLFADVADGDVTRFASRMPVANRVVLDDTAFVHPLLELLDEGRPAGVVLVSRDEARLLEWRLGELEELDRMTPPVTQAAHERSGPVGSSPAHRAYTPEREQRAARIEARTLRFLDRVGGAATALAGERDWERVLVSGGERLTEPLSQALAARLQDALIRDPRVLIGLEGATLSATVTQRLAEEHAAREERLVREVRETALAHGPAALGPSDVVGALNEARVEHLIYDPEVRYRGSVDTDGGLYAGTEHPAEVEVTPEPRLTERLVERALQTGARVTPAEGAARGALADAQGIAARLRW